MSAPYLCGVIESKMRTLVNLLIIVMNLLAVVLLIDNDDMLSRVLILFNSAAIGAYITQLNPQDD